MVSISGVRGVYGDGLDEKIVERFAYSFATLYPGLIVVGRDSRTSGKAITESLVSGLRKGGADVLDLGLAATPTTEMAVPFRSASGGVIVTASHNPGEWNGLKFLDNEGVFLDSDQAGVLIETYESLGDIGDVSCAGDITVWDGANDHHLDNILALDIIDRDLIASQKFTVCLDAVNGAGGAICTALLERLGCKVHVLNGEPTGRFAHTPEPLPENIGDLCALVRDTQADIGFAVDPDVDRLSLVSEKGIAVGEEYSLALTVDFIMGKQETDAVCNLSTSRMLEDAASRYNRSVHRSPIGEINVVQLMRKTGAMIGGEGNGGIILPALHYGRDAVLGIALILQMMGERNASLSDLVSIFPSYIFLKEKADLGDKGKWKDAVKAAFRGERMDEQDGVKVIFPDSWIHVRESNTEPIVRIYAEAPSREQAVALVKKVRGAIS